MSEEAGAATENKPAATEEDKTAASEAPTQKEAPAVPFTGFKGIFSLKSKNQSAKERFNQKA